ncbi:hypothetical protein B0H17DRAFT_1043394 [Mycena rosella]|uniref:Uncharacterized protein n=1 Tax=Mycena rosella TaxID=1033263 RepID=A0AAD7DYZ3_MYCRO|nr:hypothetical protein B0H17DRAFT_1043394 [Mycena rosella]
MLGQPDSTCVLQAEFDREDLDDELGRVYSHQRQDPRDIILREKVDEKRQLLMQVPVLPPPNEHPPNALFLPSSLKDFVVPLKAKGQANGKIPTHKFLKKAKGIPSLNVELSWVPIPAKTRMPSKIEILKVTTFFDDAAPSSDLHTQIATLLDKLPRFLSASELPTQDTWSRRYSNVFEVTSDDLDPGIARCEIILSRKERRRAAGLADKEEEDEREDPGYATNTEVNARCSKRPRLSQDGYLDDSGIAFNNSLDLNHGSRTSHAFYDAQFDPFDIDLDVDKENLPPFHAECDDCYEEFDPEHNSADDRDEPSRAPVYDHREFEALSFDSHQAASVQPTQIPPEHTPSDGTYAGMFEPHPDAIINDSVAAHPPLAILSAPDIATQSLGIAEFARLRAKKVIIPAPEPHPNSAPREASIFAEEPSHIIPENIYDRNTLRLPSAWNLPDTLHRYMVSMELVQKQALLRSLRSRSCSIDVVERDALDGVDVVLDPHTAIIFTNLLVLPSECVDLTSRIAQQSWSYARLLVIFEAYPAGRSYQPKANSNSSTASELFAYTPPVLKALSKLRRDLGISEGCGSKRRACQVQYAFADTVDEAAMFTRHFGDVAEANDESGGILWGDRAWLEDDIPEGEQDLAAADGMNRFAAFVILCQIDLGEFLKLAPEGRVERFGAFVGLERMILLNQVIERRLQALEPSESEMEMDPSVVDSRTEPWN